MYPRIRSLREHHALTQYEIAALLSMSQSGYSKYETGEADIPTPALIQLSKFYQTSVDYLLGQTDIHDPFPPSSTQTLNTDNIEIPRKRTRKSGIKSA